MLLLKACGFGLCVFLSQSLLPTCSGVIIRQLDESVAGTRLTVGETGGRDVVRDLIGL